MSASSSNPVARKRAINGFIEFVAEAIEKHHTALRPVNRATLLEAFQHFGARPQFFLEALGQVLSPFSGSSQRPEEAVLAAVTCGLIFGPVVTLREWPFGSPVQVQIDPSELRFAGAQWQHVESGATRIGRKQRTCHKVGSHLLQGRDERLQATSINAGVNMHALPRASPQAHAAYQCASFAAKCARRRLARGVSRQVVAQQPVRLPDHIQRQRQQIILPRGLPRQRRIAQHAGKIGVEAQPLAPLLFLEKQVEGF